MIGDLMLSVDARTSLWWGSACLGFAYLAYLAIRRYFDGKTRGRASIIAFAASWTMLPVTAIFIRTGWVDVHDRLTEIRTLVASACLWWMIVEFRRGNIRVQTGPKEEDRP